MQFILLTDIRTVYSLCLSLGALVILQKQTVDFSLFSFPLWIFSHLIGSIYKTQLTFRPCFRVGFL